MRRAVACALGMTIFAACASAPSLPAKAGPEEVDFYNPDAGMNPPAGYESIAPIQVEVDQGTPNADIYMRLRAEAAKLGADAVILQDMRSSTGGSVNTDMNRAEKIIARALAVYWPGGKPDM
ncbi:MAG TPA: hypothetical protein VK837_06480 [Longimicrobiales bacterium]|nr:hypothetical protein [Longimicrobiales bacterium]